eukprot:SAG22_NODE_1728_length_3710_cov_1.760731_5_plen_108_part_00
MGLTYADLCDPVWIAQDPQIFFGFWGTCLNNYMVRAVLAASVTAWKGTVLDRKAVEARQKGSALQLTVAPLAFARSGWHIVLPSHQTLPFFVDSRVPLIPAELSSAP